MSSNAFMASANKSKRKQQVIQQGGETEELVGINVRVPKSMHKKMREHRFYTEESMTALINRLLEKELG